MKKAWLIVKKLWWLILGAVIIVLYFILRKPTNIHATLPSDNDKPKLEFPKDFLLIIKKKKEDIDAEISDMSRNDLIDDLNSRYE